MRRFGEILRDARTHAGLTQKELAKNVPTDHTYISKLEKGVCLPPRKLALDLADALGMSDAEERITFLSTAGVLSDEDLQDFQLVRIGSNLGGQALTQGPPAQQLLAVAGITEAVLQQMLTLLQALTTALPQFTTALGQFMTAGAQLQAHVIALLQMNTAMPPPSGVSQTNPEKKDPHPSIEQGHGNASAGSVKKALAVELEDLLQRLEDETRERVEVDIDWVLHTESSDDLTIGKMQDEEWTQLHEQEGSLLALMYGLQGLTLRPGHYEERATPILAGEQRPEAQAFIAAALERVERRRIAFEKYVLTDKYRHILPIGALDRYVETGYHRFNDWMALFKGNPATPDQCAADIRHIIHLLKTYDNYHLGLFTGPASEDKIFKASFWELKAGKTLVVEDLRSGVKALKTSGPQYTAWFADFFARLWESEGMITEKKAVIATLGEYAKRLETAPAMA